MERAATQVFTGPAPGAGPERDASFQETWTRLRYRYWPDHWLGEILAKRWTETAIPVMLLMIVVLISGRVIGNFYSATALADTLRQAGEIGFIVLGLALVMIVGGIDLSVGSMFALTNFCALMLMHVLKWPVLAVVAGTLACGALLGAINGLLVGYLRLRAFLTTLITLIIFRSVYEILSLQYSTEIAGNVPDSVAWDFIGNGTFLGVPTSAWLYAVVAIAGHIMLTRLRVGWHILAIGGSRRSAYNGGIAVRRTVALCYVACGVLTAIAGLCFASRLATAGADIGLGMEVLVLTAAVLGGISLGGGRGSVTKALVGTLVVLLITNGLTSLSAPGGVNRMVLAAILIVAAAIDVRWLKNRQRIISKVYVSPTYHALPPVLDCSADGSGPYAVNNKLRDVTLIGLGRIEAPEDVILDRHDNLYAGSRHGDVIRFFAPDYERMEVFAHIGGQPLGMAFDREDNLHVCIGGMGLYRIKPDQTVERVTDETNRSFSSINDDSRLRLADDLDIADDGRIFFSEATTRYEMHEWPVDGLEARGNGRIICYDPRDGSTRTVLRDLKFPNGIAIASDGQSILFAETWSCCIKRYWFDGPKQGQVQTVVDNLPGYPDNINLASDGNYWLALVGMRCPAYDLAMRMPGFRKRMAKRVPVDEWLFPNINTGCVLKFSESGEILETMWDLGGQNHPMITSMREHRGYLYLGGISNNRIGRYKLADADPDFVQYDKRWDKRAA
jgi:ribose transport system permease protein